MSEAKALLRSLLRVLRSRLERANATGGGATPWSSYIVSAFREGRSMEAAEAAERLRAAQDYVALVKNITEHQALLKMYRIGLDDSERNQQMVEATARRVGFSLPKSGQ